MLSRMRHQIDKSLHLFMQRAKREFKFHLVHPLLYQSIQEFVQRKGKRIRPLLLILSYKGYRKSQARMSPSIYYVSTCIELLHNFMLIHDDIIDRSNLRRGRPTLHRILRQAAKTQEQDKLGYDLAIVAGDIVYALAIDAFLSIREEPLRKERALRYFIQTAVLTAMGEFVDTLHGVKGITQVTEQDVFLNYSLKTARYTFDCPLVVGAILAGADENDVQALAEIGLLVGQAFQIQDDIIGIFDTQKQIGKSILSDIAESKKTILVCHAFEHLPPEERRKLIQIFAKKRKTYSDLVTVRSLFIRAGSLQYSLGEINKRVLRSRALLQQLKMKKVYRQLIEKSFTELFRHVQDLGAQYKN
jgi:geranylgeranyl diphosphate synthase, type I